MRFSKTFKTFFNSFKNPNLRFQKQNLTKQSLLILGFQLNTYFFANKIFSDEKPNKVQQEMNKLQDSKIKGLRDMVKYEVCDTRDIAEGQVIEFEINDGENGKYPVVLVRFNGKLHVVGGLCTYDGKTRMKDGICFQNKLYCPLHGCAYNIVNGEVEYAPAVDDLPKFFAEERQGKVIVWAPHNPPKRLLPHTMPRDYNDLRKVVIIGTGASAQACVETLRHNGYTGEIVMISKETKYPYDKTRLTKEIKDLDYKDLQIRSAEWYKTNGVQLMLGRECVFVDKTHGSPHIKLEDGLRLEYDALVLATGSTPENRLIKGSTEKQNLHYLENIDDHKLLKESLLKAKTISVVGANERGLECVSTIRKEFPNIKEIYLVDENEKIPLKEKYGHQIGDALIKKHLENDIWFVLNQKIKEFKGDKENIKSIKFENGLEINTDLVLLFPNNRIGNSEWIDDSNLDQFDFDESGRFKSTYHMRSDYKRIFAIGDCAASQYFASNDLMPCDTWNMAWHMGETAAYNILALQIPWHQIPFSYSQQYENTLQYAGFAKYWNDVYIDGSIEDWDFVAYYSFYDEIIAVAGTPSKRRSMQIMTEAIRLEIMPLMPDIKKGHSNVFELEKEVRQAQRSGCFREGIYNVRYEPYNKDIIWTQREKSNEYYNVYKQGLTPVTNDMQEEQHE